MHRISQAYITKEVNKHLLKQALNFNGNLIKLVAFLSKKSPQGSQEMTNVEDIPALKHGDYKLVPATQT